MKKILIAVLAILVIGGIAWALTNNNIDSNGEDNNTATTTTVTVGPEMQPCTGVGEQECLVVDGELFYDSIEGFDYEPGFEYVLEIRTENVDNPPADASSIRYILVREVSRTAVEMDDEDDDQNGEEVSVVQYCSDLKSRVAGSENYVIMTEIASNEMLTDGQTIAGCVYSVNGSYGGWAPFEGQIGSYELTAADGSVLATGPLPTLNEDWMQDAMDNLALQFQGELAFDAGSYTSGELVLKNDNASGLPENDRSVTIPVTF